LGWQFVFTANPSKWLAAVLIDTCEALGFHQHIFGPAALCMLNIIVNYENMSCFDQGARAQMLIQLHQCASPHIIVACFINKHVGKPKASPKCAAACKSVRWDCNTRLRVHAARVSYFSGNQDASYMICIEALSTREERI